MAEIFHLGGWMMWPLSALSVLAVAIICERALFYGSLGFPSTEQDQKLNAALTGRDAKAIDDSLPVSHPVFGPYFSELKRVFRPGGPEQNQEVLDIFAREIADRLDRFLPLLGVIVRVAPLMGLLGTILGMINTFSRLSSAQGGVDLTMLAGGIWQALITTAVGLLIAIPVLLIQHWFLIRKKRVLDALYRVTHASFVLGDESREPSHAA